MKRFYKLLTALLIIPFLVLTAGNNNSQDEKISIVIVGHGSVPHDYPRIKEYFEAHIKGGDEYEKLEHELLYWPRNEENDPYWAGFMSVINDLKKTNSYHSVHPAFNEMCAPTVEEALNQALEQNPDKIVVVSIMLTPGGGHSEHDIPTAIEMFAEDHPKANIVYAWPYEVSEISNILVKQIEKFTGNNK